MTAQDTHRTSAKVTMLCTQIQKPEIIHEY